MKFKKDITDGGLLMTSLGAMIGSGWLFGALLAAQIAGPNAVFSWMIGGVLLIIIGLNYAELATALPLAGGIARYTHITHGSLVSFSTTWLAWLSCVAVAPTEAQAILEYASHYIPWQIYSSHAEHIMSWSGWLTAILLVLFFTIINLYAIRIVSFFNTGITFWKILIPTIFIFSLFYTNFDINNFSYVENFNSESIRNIIWAIPSAGIIYSFLGFRECISMAGEAKNPQRAIPIALIGSIIICMILYVILQIAVIGSLSIEIITNGWQKLSIFLENGSLAAVATSLGLLWIAKLIYLDALISPAGTGIIYTATTARLNYGISTNQYLPALMMKLNAKGVPVNAIMINFIIGILMLAPFPSWQALVGFQSSAIIMSYALGPVCLIVLRNHVPNLKRPFKLPQSKIIAMLTFYVCTLVAYWTGWHTIRYTGISILCGLTLMALYRFFSVRGKSYQISYRCFYWFFIYITGLTIFSWLGSFGGGREIIPFLWDFPLIAIFSIIVFMIGIKNTNSPHNIKKTIYNDPEYQEHLQTIR